MIIPPDAGHVVMAVTALTAGIALGWRLGRRPLWRRDQVTEALADLAVRRFADLPEPTDAEVRAMMTAAQWAGERTPLAYNVLALGAALLRTRRAAQPTDLLAGPREVSGGPGPC